MPSDFELVEVESRTGGGRGARPQRFVSVDPYMRGRMNDVKSYVPPFKLDQPMTGGAVGEVVASRTAAPVGDHVLHGLGWREYAVAGCARTRPGRPRRSPVSAYLGVLGMTGLTAYVGLVDIAASRTATPCSSPGPPAPWAALAGQIAGCAAPR